MLLHIRLRLFAEGQNVFEDEAVESIKEETYKYRKCWSREFPHCVEALEIQRNHLSLDLVFINHLIV
jgi:hypothetical protein